MNLFNLVEKNWDKTISKKISFTKDLDYLLGAPISCLKIVGKVGEYWVKEYGFSPDCLVTSSSGDNLDSLIGMKII